MTDDLIGQTLGQYRIEAPLGSGGMGQVYRGVHKLLGRPAAIKVMQASLANNPDFQTRFLQEARVASSLRHPNIVEIYDFGEQAGNLYLVMELMTDGSLRTLLRGNAGQPLPLASGLNLVYQAANGLAAANALNMVHRDIKPDNLLLNRLSGPQQTAEKYQLKIGDFGLARLIQGGGLTTIGMPMGTLAYMSPEQCQGKPLDGRSDLYSLGVVLYEVVTGYQPFQINDFSDALNKHMNVAPPAPRQQRPNLPPLVEEIILRCLAKKPEDRYATATALAAALHSAMGSFGAGTAVPFPSAPPLIVKDTVLNSPGVGSTLPPPIATIAISTYAAVPRVRVLDKNGQTLQVAEVKSQSLTIGRNNSNDLVLADRAVSHQHMQVSWDGKQATVKDLGSSNGTFLDNVRLLPHESSLWREQQLIHIGPFWLRLEEPHMADPQTVQRPGVQTPVFGTIGTSGTASTQVPATMVRSGRIGMAINPRMLTITPGQPATVQVTLTNVGNIVDWFTTTVEGVAPEWVRGAGQEVQLNPGMQETVALSVDVARSASNLAGKYPVTMRARSREQPDESAIVQARWTVQPFKEDALRIEPRRAGGRGSATFAVALQNSGNTPTHYELSGEDDEQQLGYKFGTNPVDLVPGREARVPLTVTSRRHWVSREQRLPFQVHARPADSSLPLAAQGEYVNKTLIPMWLFPVALVIVAAGVALSSVFGLLPILGHPPATPTHVVTSVFTPTPSPGVTSSPTFGPSPTPSPTSSPSPTPSPTPTPITANTVAPVASGLGGAIGSQYVASQDRLYFVEYNGNLSVLNNVSSGTPTYQVLGTGYTQPEDILVYADGSTAFITERTGDIVRVSLSSPDRSS
ncbi:MAG TPA: FHA domain-containing serine/threonine-protein kinase, partial [Ktedonobacteraceae bacterium]|nr:FHA domain-containing serine/threonine-protein kinase [Ktedonobacteraceae bacterium]